MRGLRWVFAGLLMIAGIGWLWTSHSPATLPREAEKVALLSSGTVASMDSPAFHYTPAWHVDARGADPQEPADPLLTPSGVLTFTYQGAELALQLATGDYWGYLYITVDGAPANLLPTIAGNVDSQGQPAAYKPLYAPENQGNDSQTGRWLRVHHAQNAAIEHEVRLEVWRSWGQTPIRAVAIDALPAPPRPQWPAGVMILLAGGLWVVPIGEMGRKGDGEKGRKGQGEVRGLLMGGVGVIGAGIGVAAGIWWLCLVGVAILALAGVFRPVLWIAAFVFALPFYFGFTLPLLPNRNFGIIDIGILGGLAVTIGHFLLSNLLRSQSLNLGHWELTIKGLGDRRTSLLWLIAGWALAAVVAAEHFDVALREWRTVFLAAALFSFLLNYALSHEQVRETSRTTHHAPRTTPLHLVIGAWILGGVAIALIGLWAYATRYEAYLVGAEGVTRLRSVYGSPNNLAAYLERTTAVSLALMLFAPQMRVKLLAGVALLPQLAALLLTFSKGGIFLALPAMMIVIALGGILLLRQQGKSVRLLWGLVAIVALAGLALIPAIGTERFRGLLDPSSATSLMRINLWRSSWQMAKDHWLLGVGPDNFLYTYRSGYLLPAAWKEPNLNHPHNFVLDWWTRLGIPGLVLGLTWWGLLMRRQWKAITSYELRITNGYRKALSLGLLAAIIASLAHGLIDVSYALPDLMIVWAVIEGVGEVGR